MYKKYIYRNGKRFGPYYCESYRDKQGNVRTRFVSGPKKRDIFIKKTKEKVSNFNKPKNLVIFLGIILGIFLLLLLGNLNYNLKTTGKVVEETTNLGDKVIAEKIAEGEIIGNVNMESIGLNIKKPVSDNKIMEFDTPDGKITLEFDLLNYSEWVENNQETQQTTENFDIRVNQTKERYKWGYDVKLKDLSFMAKIDVKADNITVVDNQTLKIGNYYLSFADLSRQNYIVNIESPVVLENVSEINITTNITEINITEINITIPTTNITNETTNITGEEGNVNNTEEENQTKAVNPQNISEENINQEQEVNNTQQEITENVEQPTEELPTITSSIIKSFTNFIIIGVKGISGFLINGIRGITGSVVSEQQTISVYVQKDFGNSNVQVGDLINLDPELIGIMGGTATNGTIIYQCGTINESGSYVLNQSITTTGTCLNVTAQNITIDCGNWSNVIYYGNISGGGAIRYGIYSNKYNTTIKNCEIRRGELATAGGPRYGIGFYGSNNSLIENVDVSLNYDAIFLSSSSNNILSTITTNNNFLNGVILSSSSSNNLSNITSNSNPYGIYLSAGSNNTITNFNIWNSSTGGSYSGVYVYESSNNSFISGYINKSRTGIYLSSVAGPAVSNNLFKDIEISNTTGSDVYIVTDNAGSEAINNTFLNVTYSDADNVTSGALCVDNGLFACFQITDPYVCNFLGCAWSGSCYLPVSLSGKCPTLTNQAYCEATSGGCLWTVDGGAIELIREWYYSAYVNDSFGNNISGANVTAYNSTGSYQFNLTTGADGKTGTLGIIDYVNTEATKNYYSPYTIYATNSSYPSISKSWNVTAQQNNMQTFTLGDIDLTSCGVLDGSNTIYTLQNPVTTNGTCFTVAAENVIIDCQNWSNRIIYGNSSDGSTYYGIYSDQYNTTIRNCEVTKGNLATKYLARTGLYFTGLGNDYVENVNASLNLYGINFFYVSNSTLDNVVSESNSQAGIWIYSGSNNHIENVIANSNGLYGIINSGSSSNLTNITTISNGYYGIDLSGSNNNLTRIISNSNVEDISLTHAHYNALTDIAADVITLASSSNNTIQDGNFTKVSLQYDPVVIKVYSTNNTFLNVSYPLSSEIVDSGSSLTRKWYYRAHTVDVASTDVGNASVNIYDGYSSDPYINLTTNSSGWTNITEIKDYVNNGGTKTYYDNSVIAANYNLTLWNSHSYNVTSQQNNLNDSFVLDVDVTPPILSGTNISMSSDSKINNVIAVINWNTNANDPAKNSSLKYGTDLSLSSGTNASLVKTSAPSITISPLMNDTIYYFNYTSCDFAGNCNTSSGSFRTISPASVGSASTGGGISCVPSWECGVCTGAPIGQTGTQTCNDLKKCSGEITKTQQCTVQESYFKPKEKPTENPTELPKSSGSGGAAGCVPNWQCGDWSDCKAVYDLEDILKARTLLKGEQERTCNDLKCNNYDKIERQECSTKQPIYAEKVEKCFDNFIEIFNEDNILISRLKLTNGTYQKLNVQMLFDEAGYCPYCFDGQKNYDEDEIDCQYSGISCPKCSQEVPFLRQNYSLMLLVLLGLTLLCFILIIWYLFLWKKARKSIIRLKHKINRK